MWLAYYKNWDSKNAIPAIEDSNKASWDDPVVKFDRAYFLSKSHIHNKEMLTGKEHISEQIEKWWELIEHEKNRTANFHLRYKQARLLQHALRGQEAMKLFPDLLVDIEALPLIDKTYFLYHLHYMAWLVYRDVKSDENAVEHFEQAWWYAQEMSSIYSMEQTLTSSFWSYTRSRQHDLYLQKIRDFRWSIHYKEMVYMDDLTEMLQKKNFHEEAVVEFRKQKNQKVKEQQYEEAADLRDNESREMRAAKNYQEKLERVSHVSSMQESYYLEWMCKLSQAKFIWWRAYFVTPRLHVIDQQYLLNNEALAALKISFRAEPRLGTLESIIVIYGQIDKNNRWTYQRYLNWYVEWQLTVAELFQLCDKLKSEFENSLYWDESVLRRKINKNLK